MRKQFTGSLCVYRDGPLSSTLTAKVTLDTGMNFYYYPCPAAFNNLITNPLENTQDITFTADTYGINPRGVKLIENELCKR